MTARHLLWILCYLAARDGLLGDPAARDLLHRGLDLDQLVLQLERRAVLTVLPQRLFRMHVRLQLQQGSQQGVGTGFGLQLQQGSQ